jgi:hypothetical protein
MSARRNKFNAKPQVVDGVRFASKAEAKRDAELVLLERAGKIAGLRRQPRYRLVVNGVQVCTYVADWEYGERPAAGGVTQTVAEDRKGVLTPAFKIKWKLAKALYPHIEWRLS